MKKISVLFLAALLGASIGAFAQRLPDNVVPSHYTLRLEPNFQTNKFSGVETIDVDVKQPTSTITLNALEINFDEVAIEANGKTQTAQVELEPVNEMAVLSVPNQIPAGAAKIHITYTGELNNKLRGFYRSTSNGHKYAVTQFEPTDARRAFPSFDEPAYKATFNITMIAPKDDEVISNSQIASDTPGPGSDQHTVKFQTTPKMSTYLVAFLVGQFRCVEGSSDGIPIRVCAVPGKQQMGKYALNWAENILHYYDTYYGIKYPFGKLDLIGIPDFEAGAMENTAAITFREEALLLDPATAPINMKKEVAIVVAHEMAHQWFGDLVTMKWWNDIWLNEGFATWMETKAVGHFKPEWGIPQDEELSDIAAMRVDSLQSTRPIRTNAETSAQINQLFDAIAYNKTAAVLRMVESYLGPESFRNGVDQYLKAHEYANATAEDFWGKLAQVADKPVDHIMKSYVDQAGIPIVKVAENCTNGNAQASQQRFFFNPKLMSGASQEVWNIPVCTSSPGSGGATCSVLAQKEATIKVATCSGFDDENAGAHGYYRSQYSPREIQQAIPKLENGLSPTERLSLFENEWALVRTGEHPISVLLDVAKNLQADRTHGVWDAMASDLTALNDTVVDPADAPAFQEFVRNLTQPVIQQLGWTSKPGDSYEIQAVRAEAFQLLGYVGRDQQAATEARKIVAEFMKNPASADTMMVAPAFQIAASQGDAQLYQSFLAALKGTHDPSVYYRYLNALADFSNPKLLERTLQLAVSPEVRSQDSPRLLIGVMMNPAGRQLTWDFVRKNWNEVTHKMSLWGGAAVVHSTAVFCSPEKEKEVQQFFSEHPIPAAGRNEKLALESIQSCVQFKNSQQQNLASFLKTATTVAEAK